MLALLLLVMCSCLVLVLLVLMLTGSSSSSSASGPLTDMGVELTKLNAAGRIPPGVLKDGKRAFEVLCRRGVLHGEGSNTNMSLRPAGFFPAESCRVRFKLWIDDAFDWTVTPSHRVGGKLGGFRIGTGASTGGQYSDEGASFRLTFYRDKGAVAYFYPQLKDDHNTRSGDPSWATLDQDPSVQAQSYTATGVHVWAVNRKPQLLFRMGGWNDVEMFCKLNTPGKYDGVMELAVNGDRRRLDTVRYRYNADMKIERFHLSVFFGGSTQDYAPRTDIRFWYTDFAFGPS